MKKVFTLRLDETTCAELENLKKMLNERTDAKAIKYAIQYYATLNERYMTEKSRNRALEEKYKTLKASVSAFFSSFETLKKIVGL